MFIMRWQKLKTSMGFMLGLYLPFFLPYNVFPQSFRPFLLSCSSCSSCSDLHKPHNGSPQTPQLSLLSAASGTLSLHAVPNLGCACRRSANSPGFTTCATQGQGNHSIPRYLQEHPLLVRGRSVGCTPHRDLCETTINNILHRRKR